MARAYDNRLMADSYRDDVQCQIRLQPDPRDPTRDAVEGWISERLLDRLRHLALAYDWRVEDLDIQSEIVQLVIACAPSDPPEKIVQTMMQTTSENIMADFPRLAEEHPAGSFWAPGYYVVAPGRLLDPEEVSRYIEHQRREQGIN